MLRIFKPHKENPFFLFFWILAICMTWIALVGPFRLFFLLILTSMLSYTLSISPWYLFGALMISVLLLTRYIIYFVIERPLEHLVWNR